MPETESAVLPLTEVLDFREGPGIMAVDFRTAGVPLIRLAGLKSGADLLAGCNFLDPDKVAQKWSQFQVEAGDVLLSTSASLGEVAVVDESGVGAVPYTGIIRFRPRDARVVAKFIPFALRSPEFKQQILEMGVGSVMNHFGPSHLKHMTLRLPPVSQQRGIADVLGALDDKIAANEKLSNTAGKLLDAAFEQRLGAVVVEAASFGEVADVSGGGTPSTADPTLWGGDVSWATPSDVTALRGPYLSATARTITDAGLAACSSPLHPSGSILMTSRATIGAFAIAQRPTAVNQGFIVVNARSTVSQWWLFHQMRARVQEFLSHANGATFLELSRGRFKQLPVWVADRSVMDDFAALADAAHARAAAALSENKQLVELRDTLLTELMSGRLRVKDAESVVEGAV